jgi:ComF family protein
MRMPALLKDWTDSLSHLFFPHVCAGCGSDLLTIDELICIDCLNQLPSTRFQHFAGNAVEKIFWGRFPIESAMSAFYFTKHSCLQNILQELKYKGNRTLGVFLGRLMGMQIKESMRFANVELLVPLPLYAIREKTRGYNQAAVLCEGIAEIIEIPIVANAIRRIDATSTQTKKNRIDRWQNMQGKFELINPDLIVNRHLLLVDDVITTGASLDACAQAMQGYEVKLSIASLAYTGGG